MKKFFLAALAVATLALVGCEKKTVVDEPTPEKPNDSTEVVVPAEDPTAEDLADYEEDGSFVVCINFAEQVCNDVVFIGSYCGWDASNVDALLRFEELEGFDGWYYVVVPVTVNEETGEEASEGKPVQLAADGSFSWDYQTGDVDSWELISGSVEISAGYGGESDLKNWTSAEPTILKSLYFKNHNSPCVEVVEYEYTISVKVPECGGYEPAIIGDFNGWAEGVAMDLQADGSYQAVITSSPNKAFKFRDASITDWSNQIQVLATNAEGVEEWKDADNSLLTEETNVVVDYSNGKWTLCE